MGMFGGARFDPAQGGISLKDRAAIFAAAMNGDASAAMKLKEQARLKPQQQAFYKEMNALVGGEVGPTPEPVTGPTPEGDALGPEALRPPTMYPLPQRSGPAPYSDPRWGKAAITAQRLGVKVDDVLKWAEGNQPKLQVTPSGEAINEKDPRNIGRVFPRVGEGQVLGPDGRVSNAPGYVDASAGAAGAVEGAKEQSRAGWDLVDVPMGDGTTVKLPRAVAAPMLARRFQGQAPGPGFGQSQNPARAAAEKVEAESEATARTTLPGDLATVDAAITSIDNLLADPVLPQRTGYMGLLPAMPGSEGVGFDAQLKQLTGQVFLDAYASLKGAGAITQDEGKAATAAKARLEKAQSESDFRAALGDLRAALDAGKARMAQRAGAASPSSGPRTQGFNSRITGVR